MKLGWQLVKGVRDRVGCLEQLGEGHQRRRNLEADSGENKGDRCDASFRDRRRGGSVLCSRLEDLLKVKEVFPVSDVASPTEAAG